MAHLSDPTNYGNAPGQGPLRPGGVPSPTDITREKKDLPSTLSKAAESQVADLNLVRDLEAGPSRVKEKAGLYLPKAPGETPADYNVRLERAVFFDMFGLTIKGLAGLVFRKDPKFGTDVPATIVKHSENIDNAGTHIDVFLREMLQDSLCAGHSAIFVEHPATEGKQSHGSEIKGEIRPYWIPIKKDNILSWRTTVEDGRTILTQVVLRETTMVPEGDFGEKEQVQYRVLYRDNGIVGFKLLEITKDNKVFSVGEGLYSNQTEIPLAEVVSSGRKGMFDSVPPLLPLALINLAHYRQWSDYDTSIYKTCVPIWVTIGEQIDPDNAGKTQVLGASHGIALPQGADAKYVTHEGGSLGSVKASLDDLQTHCANQGMAMLASEKRVAETAESKRISKSGGDSRLSVCARGLQDGVERALQFHANYLKEESGGSFEINRDFEEVLMDSDVIAQYVALVEAGFDKEIVVRMLIQGGRLPEDTDPEEQALKWDAAMAARDEAKRLEKEQAADDMLQEAKKAA